MDTEHALTRWRALLRSVAGGSTEDALSAALPHVRSLTGASSALVLRRLEERWVLHLADGGVPATAGLAQMLASRTVEDGPCPPPADWPGAAATTCHELPGHLGFLVLAWTDAPGPWADAGTDLVLAGLGRLEAEERYVDLARRVDNAQRLANMGDYDWHIESDVNTWSDQLFRIYGHPPQAFNPSYERFLSLIHPDDQPWIKELHQRAYATGEPYAMTERIVRPDGEVRYLSSNGQVVMGPEGRPVRMQGTCIDITDRVLAEHERQRSAVRFRNLVESSPDAILVRGATGVVVEANGRAHDLLGGDPVGQDFSLLVPSGTDGADGADGAVRGLGVDGRPLVLDVTMADLSHLEGEGEVAAFLHDAQPRLRHEALTAAVREGQLRRRQAMEINDNVVQGLSAALYALHADEVDLAGSLLDRTLHAARRMMNDLLEPEQGGEIRPGDLVRSTPSRLDGAVT